MWWGKGNERIENWTIPLRWFQWWHKLFSSYLHSSTLHLIIIFFCNWNLKLPKGMEYLECENLQIQNPILNPDSHSDSYDCKLTWINALFLCGFDSVSRSVRNVVPYFRCNIVHSTFSYCRRTFSSWKSLFRHYSWFLGCFLTEWKKLLYKLNWKLKWRSKTNWTWSWGKFYTKTKWVMSIYVFVSSFHCVLVPQFAFGLKYNTLYTYYTLIMFILMATVFVFQFLSFYVFSVQHTSRISPSSSSTLSSFRSFSVQRKMLQISSGVKITGP